MSIFETIGSIAAAIRTVVSVSCQLADPELLRGLDVEFGELDNLVLPPDGGKVLLGNAFSLQMLEGDSAVCVETIDVERAKEVLASGFESCVGHQDTAAVYGDELGLTVNSNRVSVKLARGDKLVVGQLVGGRLPEGCTELPDGFRIEWKVVTVY